MDRPRVERILATRRQRAEAEARKGEVAATCAMLRAFYHPKQHGFFRSPAKRKATKKTRRAGATSGGCREFIARALEIPGFRATYVTTTKDEAIERAWENDSKSGFVDILRQFGAPVSSRGVERVLLAGVTVSIRQTDLELNFSNGSQIDLFGADHPEDFKKKRGTAKHVFWVDEAQDFHELEKFYKAVVVGALTDRDGECWLTGTPGEICLGFFFDVTRDDDEPRLAGWEVHELASVDNPLFGRVVFQDGQWLVVDNLSALHGPYVDEVEAEAEAVKIRWEQTAGKAIRENAWAEDDPDLLREWFARWVKEGAKYVYEVYSVPEHELVYAPARLGEDGFPDVQAALDDLPGRKDGRDYFLNLGADLGTRAAFAFVVWAWSLQDPILYEVCSWKKSGLDYDEMADYLHAIRAQAVIGRLVADAGGGGKPAVMGWSKKWVARYNLPIEEAPKSGLKVVAIKQLNSDIRKGRIKVRGGGVLLLEWKSHVWAPQRNEKGGLVESTKTKRDAADAGLYSHRDCFHHRFKPTELTPEPGTPQYLLNVERRLEDASDGEDAGEGAPWRGRRARVG